MISLLPWRREREHSRRPKERRWRHLVAYVRCAYKRLSMPRDTAEQRAARQSRINLRASARQEQLLKQAAAATDRTMTDFVLKSAVVGAERVLADRR